MNIERRNPDYDEIDHLPRGVEELVLRNTDHSHGINTAVDWIMNNDDFSDLVKVIAKQIFMHTVAQDLACQDFETSLQKCLIRLEFNEEQVLDRIKPHLSQDDWQRIQSVIDGIDGAQASQVEFDHNQQTALLRYLIENGQQNQVLIELVNGHQRSVKKDINEFAQIKFVEILLREALAYYFNQK